MRTRVRKQLIKGVHPEAAVAQLVSDGYEHDWANRLVEHVDDKLQDEVHRGTRRHVGDEVPTGSPGIGMLAGALVGLIGIAIVYALSKAPATRHGAWIGFAIRVVLTVALTMLGMCGPSL